MIVLLQEIGKHTGGDQWSNKWSVPPCNLEEKSMKRSLKPKKTAGVAVRTNLMAGMVHAPGNTSCELKICNDEVMACEDDFQTRAMYEGMGFDENYGKFLQCLNSC